MAPSHCLNQYWILLIWPLGTNLSEILTRIQIFSVKKMNLKVSSEKWRPFCRGLNVWTFESMPADDLATPRARVLAAMILTWFFLEWSGASHSPLHGNRLDRSVFLINIACWQIKYLREIPVSCSALAPKYPDFFNLITWSRIDICGPFYNMGYL